jgi:predicted NAD/FAD-binding protein
VERSAHGVWVRTDDQSELFDQVVLATHSDQTQRILAAPTSKESEVLGAIRYQPNRAVLHTDDSVLPRRRKAWASWNYRVPEDPSAPVAVTYNMSLLQSLDSQKTYCVSLNMEDRIAEDQKIATFDFKHPLFTQEAVEAQARHGEISGIDRIHYCGAYWRHGFHEDGVVSALAVGERFGVSL